MKLSEDNQNLRHGDDLGNFPGPGENFEGVSISERARVAANLEKHFEDIEDLRPGDDLGRFAGLGANFELVSVGIFDHENKTEYPDGCPKAITVRNTITRDIFVHFNGTRDGNWEHNAAAFGGPPSPMQNWVLDYFDGIVSEHVVDKPVGYLFVTGHSQGGNNAQFVTIRSPYGDLIKNTISLDGPGFSHQFVAESIAEYGGEAYFNLQRRKIWAFNGEYDFVSVLGQTQIIPEEGEL